MFTSDIKARLPIYEEMYRNGREISAQLLEDLRNCVERIDEIGDLMEQFVASLSPEDQERVAKEIEG